MTLSKIALAVCCVGLMAGAAQAQESGTLKKIKDTGVISLGNRESSIPFSFYDNNHNVVGYANDVAMAIVAEVKKELKLTKLDVKQTPITSQNRIPLVQNGTIDIECGSTTNNADRQKQAAFSNTFFIIGTRLLTKNSSGVKDFDDLKGKNVVTTAGTTSERLLRQMDQDKKMGMNIISAKDHGEAAITLHQGRAVAFMMDDALLAGERAKFKDAKDYSIVGKPQSYEAYGCMMRKDDPQFKKVVDTAVANYQKSGQAFTDYKKWFQSPIPALNGTNMDFPPSAEMAALWKAPNDSADVTPAK
ncbi:glutamate/aspartate ABC transporter substrate-binding protein [Pandoraea pneumonica]|jgi:glutamate/aspartate transport system substrate-binding protein|uniref:ABC transporter n=1 Tax=Pandoraea pneumonica TaxID=2508299 RepID=A0A5E4W3A6_9BURK|nr:glutamate/aspartate ABC transporter substrate-binding protein [Pandoraea pneumonica]VVE18116.1 ABC transporter [Pandoraea pneumonica]